MGSFKKDRMAADRERQAQEQGHPPDDGPHPRVLITGDRYWRCQPLAASVLRRVVVRYGPGLVVLHGACTGIDESFALAAKGLGLAVEAFPADWDRWGKKAGPKRNGEMIAAGATLCVALHRFLAGSKGTKDACRQAIAAGIPTYLISGDDGGPRRLLADDPRLED